MSTITKHTYGTLPEHLKQQVLDQYRDWYVSEPDWASTVIEHWEERLKSEGFCNPRIRWSGFYSSGDGASFTSDTAPHHEEDSEVREAWSRVVLAAGLIGLDCPDLVDVAEGWVMDAVQAPRYYHDKSVCVFYSMWTRHRVFNHSAMGAYTQPLIDAVAAYYSERLPERVSCLSREIYNDLEAEYEYLTADEQVAYALEENAHEFEVDEEGCLL
jgi:hypothetical protein